MIWGAEISAKNSISKRHRQEFDFGKAAKPRSIHRDNWLVAAKNSIHRDNWLVAAKPRFLMMTPAKKILTSP